MADSKVLNPSSSASPPPNCAICLGSCSNKCFSDTCMHQFCFKCLLQWSKIKAECPLCKQPFKSIIHNVKSNEEYEEHIVEEPRPIHIIDNEQYLYLPQSPPNPSRQHRFHFRTTFTVNTHGENAIQQMLLSHSLTNGISISNYMPGSWPPYSRRSRRDNISTTTSFRRSIYNDNLWASAPNSVSGRYREVTPEYFQANPASRTRLAPWLNRELNALLHENTQDVMQLVDTIMDYLLRYHICSRSFRNLLQSYLGEWTDHFVHEFYNFMRSPFDMIGYDRHVLYLERPTTPTPFIDISEDDDSDVMIVEENPVIIEVSSNESNDSDVIMTSFPAEMPKPQMLPACRRSHKRYRHIELSSSSSSSEREQSKKEERSRKHKKSKSSQQWTGKKPKQSKLEDLLLGDSSSSELDDIPLAKYVRIKASIERILKRKSHLSKLKTSKKKLKTHRRKSNHERSSSRKKDNSISKSFDLLSPLSSKPHCSKYIPQRRDSSSSSSTSSSSSSTSTESESSRYSSENKYSSSTITSPRNTPPPRVSTPKEKKKKKNSQQQWLDLSSSSRRSLLNDSTRNEGSTDAFVKHHNSSKKDKRSQDFCNYPLYKQPESSVLDGPSTSGTRDRMRLPEPSFVEGPSTSGYRDRNKVSSPKRNLDQLSPRGTSRVHTHNRQDLSSDQPLELTNRGRLPCRYTPNDSTKPSYVSLEPNEVISPAGLLTLNSNLVKNVVNVSNSSDFQNVLESPDLIDLSISKMKTDNTLPDSYSSSSCPRNVENSYQMNFSQGEEHTRQRIELNQAYPWIPTSHLGPSSQTSHLNLLSPKTEPKAEPVYPEYQAEQSSTMWAAVASSSDPSTFRGFRSNLNKPEYNSEHSSGLWAAANDSINYKASKSHPRKSVIQNVSNSRDYVYNDAISPRWFSSNSPTYPGPSEYWSESSD